MTALQKHTFTVIVNGVSMPVSYDVVAEMISDGIHFLGWLKVEQTEPPPRKITYKNNPDNVELSYPDYPLNDGALIIKARGEAYLFRFNIPCIEKGLAKMFAEQPGYSNDVLDETNDHETAQIFWEYCIYGQPISD